MSVTQLDSRDHLLLALLVGAPLAAVTTLNGQSPVFWSCPDGRRRPCAPGERVPAAGRRSAPAGFPAEEPEGQRQPGHPPGGDHQHVGPVEGRAEERGLHPVGEVLDREDPRDPQDPLRGVVAERNEYPVTRC